MKWRNKQADIADRAMKLNMIFAMNFCDVVNYDHKVTKLLL